MLQLLPIGFFNPTPACVLASMSPKEALAQSVLAEVPGQVVTYFNMNKLSPPNTDTPPAPVPTPPATADMPTLTS
ncbi:unnamed protein product [Oncorhynchus mykiss]|uniref:Uncharacterized protein n=1 Tax=Oncorhynchus mykiss TaxID=8022 RepID=A0A060W1X7_ONCMY|nr:unnamed protein product [Oncorhynchus mykiss]